MKRFLTIILASFFAVIAINGCATMRKLDAAKILKNTQMEFKDLTLDSVSIDPDLFEKVSDALKKSILPNPQVVLFVQNLARGIIETKLGEANLGATIQVTSNNEDSLWIAKLDAKLVLDTLVELPLTLKDSCILAPGANQIMLSTQFPLDKRVFQLAKVNKYSIKGVLVVALDADGEKVPLDFNIERTITPEEIKNFEDNIRQNILNGLIGDWVGALLPED